MENYIKFQRNTHDQNRKYRGDDYFVNNNGDKYNSALTCYTEAHTFDTGKPLTFDEYYDQLTSLAAGGAYDTPPQDIGIVEALRELATLIEYKLVTVSIPQDLTLKYKNEKWSKNQS